MIGGKPKALRARYGLTSLVERLKRYWQPPLVAGSMEAGRNFSRAYVAHMFLKLLAVPHINAVWYNLT